VACAQRRHQSDYRDEQNPQFPAVNPAAVAPNAFTFRRIEQLESFTKDEDQNARVDLLLPIREGDNARASSSARATAARRSCATTVLLRHAVRVAGQHGRRRRQDFTTDRNYTGNYQYGTFSSPSFLAGLNLFNPAQFTLADQPAEYAAGNFDAEERITAGYGMIEQSFGPTVSWWPVCAWRTRTSTTTASSSTWTTRRRVPPPAASRTPTCCPSINLRWDVSKNTVVRGAWTNTLARPNYFDLVPYREISLEDNELSTRQPALKPTRSMNFDLWPSATSRTSASSRWVCSTSRSPTSSSTFTQFQAVDPVTGQTFSQISQPRNGAEATAHRREKRPSSASSTSSPACCATSACT
jgi:hypothetical protein